jgi:hypothetical protein
MKKPFRIFYVMSLALGIVVVVAVLAIGLFANHALKVAVGSAGTKALNVGVRVDHADLSVFKGRIGLENLSINNPPGYQHDRLVELNGVVVLLDTKSLLDETVNITDIELSGTNVVLEQRGVSGNNLQDVIEQLPDEQESKPGGKKLHIDTLEITDAVVKVKLLPVPGQMDTLSFKLWPIKLTDLGGEKGLDSAALTRTILLAIAGGIAKQGAGVLPDEMLGSLVAELAKLGALPRALLEGGLKVLGDGVPLGEGAGKGLGAGVMKGAEEIGKGITEGVKTLLGQKKKEQD